MSLLARELPNVHILLNQNEATLIYTHDIARVDDSPPQSTKGCLTRVFDPILSPPYLLLLLLPQSQPRWIHATCLVAFFTYPPLA